MMLHTCFALAIVVAALLDFKGRRPLLVLTCNDVHCLSLPLGEYVYFIPAEAACFPLCIPKWWCDYD